MYLIITHGRLQSGRKGGATAGEPEERTLSSYGEDYSSPLHTSDVAHLT